MKYITFFSLLLLSAFSYAQVTFPIDFESSTITYSFSDFGGGQMSREDNPDKSGINTSNKVARMIKNAGDPWGGSVLQLAGPVDLSTNKHFKMKVWTPGKGRKVLLKVENQTNGAIAFEQERVTSVGNAWEELVFDFTGANAANSYEKLVFIFDLGTVGNGTANFTFYLDDIVQFKSSGGKSRPELPITFQDTTTVDYKLTDFGGNASSIVVDPTDPKNLVGKATKTAGAELWAGTTNGGSGLAKAIPFTAANTKMSVRVWSPDANTPIRLKAENAANGAISVETEATTTKAASWETLEFNFNNPAPGTAALNPANTYDKISIFFNFGTTGAAAGEKTYYWDDVAFVGGGGGKLKVDLPITFQDTAKVDYLLSDFGGNISAIVKDPTDPNNLVGKAVKATNAELWAGTTNGGTGLAKAIPFAAGKTKMTARVWSPDANTPIRLKVENAANGAISVETETKTTKAAQWEILVFDFSQQAPGTAALNLANSYDKISIFFNFGTTGATAGEKTYYWDDISFGKARVDLPISFQDTTAVDYALTDFGGNASSIVVDPTNPANLVGKATKTAGAELWAGTTNGGSGLNKRIPFTAANTKMSVRVWSPDANTPVRLKAENAANGTISVETEAKTTKAAQWETLEFNFSNQAAGTAALNPANVYNKVSIFFNFGTTGATAGEKTYYWDDVSFVGGGGSTKAQMDLPITFQDTTTVAYTLVDFGGNASSIVVDPTNPNNLVGKATKTAGAELWAGTTNGGAGLAKPIPFVANSTKMSVRVWSPDANTPIRLKVEDATNPAISVETEAKTTKAATWETLEFNFANQAPGTAAINFANTYNKVSIFFNFGTTGATAGEKTYYWDDIKFGGVSSVSPLDASEAGIRIFPNPASEFFTIAFPEPLSNPALVSILDANGRLIKALTLTQQNSLLPLEDINDGVYYLRIEQDAKAYFQKLLLMR